jgi:ribonuclease P protein component
VRSKALSTRREFDRVLRGGQRGRSDELTAFVAPASGGISRLGLVVRGRGAVNRNRAKRRLREAFSRCGVPNKDVVVRAGVETNGLPFQELVERLRTALSQAGAM